MDGVQQLGGAKGLDGRACPPQPIDDDAHHLDLLIFGFTLRDIR